MPRGRPRGKVSAKATAKELKDWVVLWNSGNEGDKAVVLEAIDAQGYQKDVIIARLAAKSADVRKRTPAMNHVIAEAVSKLLQALAVKVIRDSDITILKKYAEDSNLVINLMTLETTLEKRRVPRQKRQNKLI